MADSPVDPLLRSESGPLGRLLTRVWTAIRPPAAPDFAPLPSSPPEVDHRAAWLAQLARTRYALEQTRFALLRDGWTSGAWFSVPSGGSAVRRVSTYEAFGLLAHRSRAGANPVAHGCLIGTLLRMVDDPDQVPTVADAWHCVDELFEAMHESLGHVSFPPGRSQPHGIRQARLQALTAWNDERGRSREQVVDLVDRAIARTIVASCR